MFYGVAARIRHRDGTDCDVSGGDSRPGVGHRAKFVGHSLSFRLNSFLGYMIRCEKFFRFVIHTIDDM